MTSKCTFLAATALLGGASFAIAIEAEPSFSLSFDAPSSVVGAAGTPVDYEAVGKLATSGLPGDERGAQGWSISFAAEGGNILAITSAGTDASALFKGEFDQTEITTGAGNEGAVSAIVLSLTKNVTLPPSGVSSIIRVTLQAVPPAPVLDEAGDPRCEPLVSRVFFVDGRTGSGQPVENKVTWKGATFIPTTTDATTRICPTFVRPLLLRVDVDGASPGDKSGDQRPWTVDVGPGSSLVPVNVRVVLESNLPDTRGGQGWALSVPTEDCFNLSAVTTSGTAVDQFFSDGFNKTELVDAARNGGRHGAVSAVVLSLAKPRTLPPVGESVVLKLEGSLDASSIEAPGDLTDPCNVRVAETESEFLQGEGQPVKTGVTIAGFTRTPGVCNAAIRLRGAREGRFVRGNANNDTKDNLADAIWIVNEVFRSGRPTLCRDAADANNDGRIDVSDALYLIGYQFQSATAPPAPFPDCGIDPEGETDGLNCGETQERC